MQKQQQKCKREVALKRLSKELPYNPTIPRKMKYIFTQTFTAALSVIAQTWKQPNCPLTDEKTKCGTPI